MFNVILYEPEIPPNTGNIMRLCANTGCALHLVGPLGFDLEEKKLRRAGLDYREFAEVKTYDGWSGFSAAHPAMPIYACTTKAEQLLSEVTFEAGVGLLFGPETRGLPDEMLATFAGEHKIRVPMRGDSRSLNLSNAVAVVVYEAWRQQGFAGAS